MKKVLVVLVAVMLLATTTVISAFAQGWGPERKGGPCFRHEGRMGFAPGINLSKEQMEKMWELREKHRSDTQTLRHDLFQKGIELRTLFSDPKASDAAILAKQKEVDALKQQIENKRMQLKLAERKVLTPEQLTKLGESGWGPGPMMGFKPVSGHGKFSRGGCRF